MNVGLYQNAASLSALEQWQDIVTKNITSSQINGYKRRAVQMGGVAGGQTFPDPSTSISRSEGLQGMFPEARTAIAFQAGENHPTRRELDLALSGPGFFHVQTPEGDIAYTRAGQFSINPDRLLVNSMGWELMSTDGDAIQLQPQAGAPVVDADGTVKQGGEILGKLAVSEPTQPAAMIPLVAGVFAAGPGAGMQEVEEPDVLQGYLESSNVKPLREMIDLVSISRAYEANHKLIQTRDQLLGRTLESLT